MTKKDTDAIIEYYAEEKNVPKENRKIWMQTNYRKNIRAAQYLLRYCGNLEEAKAAIHRCRIEREKNKMEWSLAGDVVRNISQWNVKINNDGGQKKWD